MSTSIYNIPVKTIQGEDINLNQYQGKVLLVVNVASKCGLTPQYEGLEKLYQDKKSQGLEILGFPANNFLAQEPGSDAEIQEFCSLNYQVDFPLFSKISVAGMISIRYMKRSPKRCLNVLVKALGGKTWWTMV